MRIIPIIKIGKNAKALEWISENKIETSINNIRQNYNSDIFGFLDLIYKQDYKTYKKLKNSWYKGEFKNIKINIKTAINIIGKGNVQEGNNEKN